MSYETFFSLGLDLDDKTVPQVCTASGTDMGAVGYTTFDFQINGHPFTQQFIVCHRQTRPLILGQDFSICYHPGSLRKDYIAKSPPSTIVAPYTQTNPSKLAYNLVDKQPFQCCKYRHK